MEEQIEFIEYVYHAPLIQAFCIVGYSTDGLSILNSDLHSLITSDVSSKWLWLTALLAASHSTLVAAIVIRGELFKYNVGGLVRTSVDLG
ncbi:uncharacterized protein CLUP02_06599 [Colletotrichum lupini]|uniref:Uncharacterized protein n=1 Tax=Colletotrichum lupini TaxID=145971 RepID=A0A9Q8WEU0_9PEZI|nr:uncharacterized protein CLUP02_06599 [Colletotrichum lupini]KAK1703017.1 hypothetical protein BDP67DRAFT_584997 [Colletotrichum lupini]UQC81113.1 hypothetical protein CLUP02_06599 [Colletotrichum lupini]